MPDLWFTADTHYGHGNIIRYCDRPFADVREMDETLIANWNDRVKPDDMIWHLGDVSFHNSSRTRAIIDRLNGHKYLVPGNHDHKREVMESLGFEHVFDEAGTGMLHRGIAKPMFLRHQPMYTDENRHIQLCGHVHDQWATKLYGNGLLLINVGVDVRGYAPISIDEIKEIVNGARRTDSVPNRNRFGANHHDAARRER